VTPYIRCDLIASPRFSPKLCSAKGIFSVP